ncbi:MAG: hypothetical protein R6V06_01020 [Kiritimatiellia bacterium]
MKKIFFVLLLVSFSFCGCRIEDERELVIDVPQMKTEQDVTKIRNSLTALRGIDFKSAVFDTRDHKVTLKFDSMVVAHKNIEIAIAEAGYDANGIKALNK